MIVRRLSPNKSTGLYSVAVAVILFWSLECHAVDYDGTPQESGLWRKIRSGEYVVMLRHALAPGVGDPDNFNLKDCSTQRNLSHEGREQAKRIGERFRANGIQTATVYSSQWCRCLDTARLLQLGPVKELPPLNSLHDRYDRRDLQTRQLKDWFDNQDLIQPVVLVSHRATISALTGEYPASGEMVVVSRNLSGGYSVVGRLATE